MFVNIVYNLVATKISKNYWKIDENGTCSIFYPMNGIFEFSTRGRNYFKLFALVNFN